MLFLNLSRVAHCRVAKRWAGGETRESRRRRPWSSLRSDKTLRVSWKRGRVATPLSRPFNRTSRGRSFTWRVHLLASGSASLTSASCHQLTRLFACRYQILYTGKTPKVRDAERRDEREPRARRGRRGADGAVGPPARVRQHRRVRAAAIRRRGPRHSWRPSLDSWWVSPLIWRRRMSTIAARVYCSVIQLGRATASLFPARWGLLLFDLISSSVSIRA